MKQRRFRTLTFVAVAALSAAACDRDSTSAVIPANEQAEVRRLAFQYALRYEFARMMLEGELDQVLAPMRRNKAQIQSQPSRCPPGLGETMLDSFYCAEEAVAKGDGGTEAKIFAVAEVRGVQTVPLSRTRCEVRFDFVPSEHPQAELPPRVLIFERFEGQNGEY